MHRTASGCLGLFALLAAGCIPPVGIEEPDTARPPLDDSVCEGVDCDSEVGPEDNDSDGYTNDVDCDDFDAQVNPGKTEVWYDGTDQNCDGNDMDQDLDGYTSSRWDAPDGVDPNKGTDCDDTPPGGARINPEAEEIWYDGVDQDCDEACDWDQDGDGDARADATGSACSVKKDCDDEDATVNSSALELLDAVDNDCDGAVDGALSGLDGRVTLSALSSSSFGYRLAVADPDGDGYGDVVVGAPSDSSSFAGAGTVLRFDGDLIDGSVSLSASAAEWKITAASSSGSLGAAFVIDDADRDGADDLAVVDAGADQAYLFPASKWGTTGAPGSSASVTLLTGQSLDDAAVGVYEGAAVSVLLVGSNTAANGSVYAWPAGALTAGTVQSASSATFVIGDLDNTVTDGLGKAIAVVDTNLDGVDDILVGAPEDSSYASGGGAVYVIDGSLIGTASSFDVDISASVVKGNKANWYFGQQIFVIGDVSGDGEPDVAVLSQDTGKTQIHLIESGSKFTVNPATLIPKRVTVSRTLDRGAGVLASGDLDGDGLGDLAVGNPDAAAAYVFLGSTISTTPTLSESGADATVTGSTGSQFGSALAIGDVLGLDGVPELVVSAPAASGVGAVTVIPTSF